MKILDKGFIKLVNHMGNDASIVQSARVSYANKGSSSDEALINYLWKNNHGTPFESVVFTFHIKCPIFVARQWFRHRIASYNEISGRYVKMSDEFYIPNEGRLLKQSTSNKQGSSFQFIDEPEKALEIFKDVADYCYSNYEKLLELGVAKELARTILPLNLYTEFYWTVNLRSLFNFIGLRSHRHAQHEIGQYSNALFFIIKDIVPIARKAFLIYDKRDLPEK